MATYKITYDHGLANPVLVEAETPEAAVKEGLAKYRYQAGWTDDVDFWPADFVVKSAELQEA